MIRKCNKIILLLGILSISSIGIAQDPPPPPGEGNTNTTENQLGGAAHIGGGVLILLTLSLAYGGRRLYQLKSKNKEELV